MRAVNENLTPREIKEYEYEREIAELQAQYQLKFKTLELDIKKAESRWTQLFRIPLAIISLPVRLLFGFGYIAHAIRKTDPSDKFWDYLSKL